jgi:hypothetical protein
MLLAFSCKGRWFCPSCHEKKVLQFGEFAVGEVLYPVPHCQMVFTLPRMLRVYFRHNRERLSALCRCAVESLQSYLRALLGLPDGAVGVIAVIHTFGDYARFHPHLHLVAAEGLFRKNGVFHVAPRAPTQPLEDLFRARVLKLLRREGKIDDRQIRALLGWKHSGFSAWRGEPISRRDRRAQENLAQYVMRNPFSVEKMSYVAETGTVIYRSGMSHGKHKKNFEVLDAPAFIAAVTQHIPPKGFQMVRYYGWYSNRALGERKRLGLTKPGADIEEGQEGTVLDVADHQPTRVPSKTWRQLIQKVWEVDPLVCPRCGGEMKIIALIEEPAVVERILKHLELWRDPEPRRGDQRRTTPCDAAEAPLELCCEPVDDGWPGYEEPTYTLH